MCTTACYTCTHIRVHTKNALFQLPIRILLEDFLTDTIPVCMKCRRQLSYKTLNITSINTERDVTDNQSAL